jgi:hypothetical protein
MVLRLSSDHDHVDITFNGDESWTSVTRADLTLRGNTPPFDHRDINI